MTNRENLPGIGVIRDERFHRIRPQRGARDPAKLADLGATGNPASAPRITSGYTPRHDMAGCSRTAQQPTR